MKSLIDKLLSNKVKFISDKDILSYETSKDDLLTVMNELKNNSELLFSQLTDLCAVDYSAYGQSEWQTKESTSTGYNRGITPKSNARKQYEEDSDLDKLVNYSEKWDEQLGDDIVWPDLKKFMKDYKRFLTIDKKQYRIRLLNLIEGAP